MRVSCDTQEPRAWGIVQQIVVEMPLYSTFRRLVDALLKACSKTEL